MDENEWMNYEYSYQAIFFQNIHNISTRSYASEDKIAVEIATKFASVNVPSDYPEKG